MRLQELSYFVNCSLEGRSATREELLANGCDSLGKHERSKTKKLQAYVYFFF